MRTPWRFLSDLASRKSSQPNVVDNVPDNKVLAVKVRLAEPSQSSPSDMTEVTPPIEENGLHLGAATAVEHGILADKGHRDISEVQTDRAELPGSSADGVNDSVAKEGSDDKIEASSINADLSTNEKSRDVLQPNTTVGLTPEQSIAASEREGVRAMTARPKAGARKPVIDLPSTRKRTMNENLVELDAEIVELRQILSSKLLEQNKQLRQMLQRFPD